MKLKSAIVLDFSFAEKYLKMYLSKSGNSGMKRFSTAIEFLLLILGLNWYSSIFIWYYNCKHSAMNPLRFVISFLLASTFCSGLTSCAARKAKKAAKKQKQEIIDAKVTEELIIGNYSGHCFGKCFTTVKITQNGVFTDTNTLRNSTLQPYVYFEKNMGIKLSDSLNNEFQKILKLIPSNYLSSEPIIGCPDCADQGGYIVIYKGKQVMVDPHNHPAAWDSLINNFRELMLKYMYEFEKL